MLFNAGGDSGIALVSARSDMDALQVLKNGGRFNAEPSTYTVLKYRNIGLSTGLRTEILMEAYTNAEGVYDRLMATVDCLKGDKGDPGDTTQSDWNQTDDSQLDYIKNKPTIPAAQVNADWNASSGVAQILNKPTIPSSVVQYTAQMLTDAQQTQARTNIGAGTYSKPSGGIPSSDMASAVQTSLGKADSAYQKPSDGIPSTDMTSAVQTSLGKADSAYQKPGTGIPATDLASGVIPDVSAFITKSVNDLVNYYTKSETYTQAQIDAIVGAIQGFSYESVASLPTASASTMGKIYLVPSADAQAQNVKDEFITIEGGGSYSWEQIGSTAIDLSSYVTTSALNTALASYTTTADLTTLLAAKQDTIADLADIRSGAALGATALQPGDLPTVPTISTDIETDKASNAKTASPKAVADYVGNPVESVSAPTPNDGTIIFTYRNGDTVTVDLNHVHPQYYSKAAESSQPVGGFAPDVVYALGELSGSVTFALASAVSGNVNHYFWTFETGASAPTVTWPNSVTWLDGSAPTPGASKHCEVSILGGVGVYMEA